MEDHRDTQVLVDPSEDLHETEGTLRTHDGVMASIERDGELDRLRVRDPHGRLVFEYAQGRMVLCAPEGDLELRAPQGQVKIEGMSGVSLSTEDRTHSLHVSPQGVKVEAQRVEVVAERVTADLQESSVRAKVLRTVAERVITEVERMDVRAGRVIERAKEVYREVEGLSQTRAGRMKLIAEKAWQVLAEDVTIKARRDAKIKGEKIYLA
jgi:hypothetical protein